MTTATEKRPTRASHTSPLLVKDKKTGLVYVPFDPKKPVITNAQVKAALKSFP